MPDGELEGVCTWLVHFFPSAGLSNVTSVLAGMQGETRSGGTREAPCRTSEDSATVFRLEERTFVGDG